MKAISIRQPWAYFILLGLKAVENRTWSTEYRGPLVIHAGLRPDPRGVRCVEGVIHRYGLLGKEAFGIVFEAVAGLSPKCNVVTTTRRGALLGVVDLVAVTSECASPWFEGPVGWVFANPRAFEEPIPWKGQLGLFDVPDELVREAMAA